MKLIFWLWAAALMLCLFAMGFIAAAHAQGFTMIAPLPCLNTADLLKRLDGKYHEEVIGAGISGGGEQIRLFVSPEKTFTIIATKPGSSFSCLYAGGADWTINEVPKGDDL